jgi:CBS domain-containing protein
MSLTTPIIQLIDRDPISVEISQKLSDAFSILSGGRLHHLPVVAGRKLVGLLGTTDMLVLRSQALPGDESEVVHQLDKHYTLEDVIRTDVITVSDRAALAGAAKLQAARGAGDSSAW